MRHDAHYVEELTRTNRTIGRNLPIEKLVPNPEQPRVEIGDLTELSGSIKEKGVLEPILVRPEKEEGTWLIIAGERRWRAATLAGLEEVPCIELELTDEEVAEIALIENLQRKDLTIWEVADGLALLAEKFDYTHEEIARKIGKSRSTVTESLTIAGLPESIREKCRAGDITAKSVLLEIARQFDEEAMHRFVDNITGQGLTRQDIRQKARPRKSVEKKGERKNTASANEASGKNVFDFRSAENDFELKITFQSQKEFDDHDILKALKEVFDRVKANL